MTRSNTCTECKTEIAVDAVRGLCTRCLFTLALFPGQAATVAEPAGLTGPLLGSRLRYVGDYELLEEVARGGMGVVFKARQASLNRVVALKAILSGALASPQERERFRKEAEGAARLQHPNIVAIHEIGTFEEHCYFSMDFVEGETLAHAIAKGTLTPFAAAECARKIAEAVQYAHNRGILHRDLKPQNVLMDCAGEPRITDFGLAKQLDADGGLTVSNAVMGTPSYMAPEQAAARHDLVSPATDVYALGAILYEMLTGRPPFRKQTSAATITAVIEEPPIAPTKLQPTIPRDLETICLKCLEKRVENRYGSAQDVADELGRFLRHEAIVARPASRMQKAWSWTVRNPWWLIAIGAGLMFGVTAAAFTLWQQNQLLAWKVAHPGEALPKMQMRGDPGVAGFLGFVAAAVLFAGIHDRKQKGWALTRGQLAWVIGTGIFEIGMAAWILSMAIRVHVWSGLDFREIAMAAAIGTVFFWAGAILLWESLAHFLTFSMGSQSVAWIRQRPVLRIEMGRLLAAFAAFVGAAWIIARMLIPADFPNPIPARPFENGVAVQEAYIDAMREIFVKTTCFVAVLLPSLAGYYRNRHGLGGVLCPFILPIQLLLASMPFLAFPTMLAVQTAAFGVIGGMAMVWAARIREEAAPEPKPFRPDKPLDEVAKRNLGFSFAMMVVLGIVAWCWPIPVSEKFTFFGGSAIFTLWPVLAVAYRTAEPEERKGVVGAAVAFGIFFLLNLVFGFSGTAVASAVAGSGAAAIQFAFWRATHRKRDCLGSDGQS